MSGKHYVEMTLVLYADEQDGSTYETAETADRLVREQLDALAYDYDLTVVGYGEVTE